MLAAVDQGEDDVAQGGEGQTQARGAVTSLTQHLHTAPQVDQVQPATTSRHYTPHRQGRREGKKERKKGER